MELAKKNILNIICGVVVLVAIVFYFVGVKPKYSELKTKMSSSPAQLTAATGLLNQPRTTPVLNDDKRIIIKRK